MKTAGGYADAQKSGLMPDNAPLVDKEHPMPRVLNVTQRRDIGSVTTEWTILYAGYDGVPRQTPPYPELRTAIESVAYHFVKAEIDLITEWLNGAVCGTCAAAGDSVREGKHRVR